jgi:hypothetical protein
MAEALWVGVGGWGVCVGGGRRMQNWRTGCRWAFLEGRTYVSVRRQAEKCSTELNRPIEGADSNGRQNMDDACLY